jgi:hypothetical protein
MEDQFLDSIVFISILYTDRLLLISEKYISTELDNDDNTDTDDEEDILEILPLPPMLLYILIPTIRTEEAIQLSQ